MDDYTKKVSMDIRQIRYFVSAVKGGSLSAAAKEQFVTVQAVSKALSELEREIGHPLLVRGNHGVRPTVFGEVFFRRASTALGSFNNLQDFVDTASDNASENYLLIALSSPPFKEYRRILDSLSAFLGKRLGITVDIVLAPATEAFDALRAGSVGAACVLGEYTAPDTDTVGIGTVPAGVVVASEHPLATRSAVSIADIEQYPLLSSPWLEYMIASINKAFREHGHAPQERIIRCDGFSHDAMVRNQATCFAAYLPSLAGMHQTVSNIPLIEKTPVTIPIQLVTLKGAKSDAYRALEGSIGTVLRVDTLFQ